MRTLLSGIIVVFLITSASAVTVTVSSPAPYSTVSTSFTVKASATSGNNVTGWSIYVDGNRAWNTPGPTSSISPTLSVSSGTHKLTVRAWDSSGAYGSAYLTVTASSSTSSTSTTTSSSALPTPPSSAQVFSRMEEMSGYNSCSANCAGGQSTTNYWMAQFQGSPSMDGSSTEFFNGGGPWANVLWYKTIQGYSYATHFLWDFYIRFNSTTIANLHSAELDVYQAINGIELMAGSQCNFGKGRWDTWNQAGGYWVGTSIPCPRFSADTWHHIQWYVTRPSSKQYKYVTLVVDGKAYSVNQTFYGNYTGWSDKIGIHFQTDLGSTGTDAHMWVDKVKLTVW